jgi:DNA-binding beta-propeller fold protein YncE
MKTISKPQESNNPITIVSKLDPIQSPTEKPDFIKLDVYGEGIYCEDRNKIVKVGVIEPKLDKPVNIAVTKDGSAVYVVNGKCGRTPYLRNISNYHDTPDLCNIKEMQDVDSDIVENNLIIKITKDGKKQAIIGDNSGVFFCSNDGVIALDENDNLYFSANRRIYKVKNDKYVELVANLDELEKGSNSFYKTGMIGGLIVNNETIYIDVRNINQPKRIISENGINNCIGLCNKEDISIYEGEIKQIKNNKLTSLFVTLNYGKSKMFLKENRFFVLNPIINTSTYINYDKNLFYVPLSRDDIYRTSVYTVAELDFETNSWSAPYGEYLEELSNSLTTNILINSKNEFIFIVKNGILKLINEEQRYPEFFVGKKELNYSSSYGYKDGKGSEALLNKPSGMAIDANDNIYVADTGNNAIRKITTDGTVSTFYKE